MRAPSLLLFFFFSFLCHVRAQSPSVSASSSSSSSPATSQNITVFLTTSSVPANITSTSAGQLVTVSTQLPTIFNVTRTLSPTPTQSANATAASASPSPSATSNPFVLDTILDPAFGVLGAILILTGLPSTFWGHKNRWTSFFLTGFYTLSLVCFVLITKFGIIPAINPPSKTLRGLFVLSAGIAGVAGGGIAIFFWKGSRYFIGAWGGFALALWVQCFQNGGLIKPIGFRWILYIGCAVIGFVFCTIPKIHYHVLLISTAIVGSSAFMLGIDCYTTAGLKEFYVWNVGFRSMFPKYTSNNIQFPVTQTMQIELGLAAAMALMGIAVQLRILRVLQRKLKEIAEEQQKRDEEAELHAAGRFAEVLQERDQWEKEHPSLGRHDRNDSGMSHMPLMKDRDETPSPTSAEHRSSTFTLVNDRRPRYKSSNSEFVAAPTPEEELKRAARNQSLGALPALDLGLGIQEDVPRNFMAKEPARIDSSRDVIKEMPSRDMFAAEGDLKRKEELLAEIQTIRRSIDALKSETPAPSSSAESRRPSLTSRRTTSIDASAALLPITHLRPPRESDPRGRVRSMESSGLMRAASFGESIDRPTSVPLRPEDWDSYVQDRRLLQPPVGITAPIPTSATPRAPLPPAVSEALQNRKRRENALGLGDPGTDSSEDVPLARVARAKRSNSVGGNVPVTILPPRKPAAPIVAPTPQRASSSRVRTFEELNERHREKMRGLQAPLTQAEKEAAELGVAKQRWERAKALEREAVTKRQAEKAAQHERRKKVEEEPDRTRHRSPEARVGRHSRSLSADKLGATGPSSKRLSTMKVEDWQRHQADVTKRNSRVAKTEAVPFPDPSRGRERQSREHAV